MKNPKDKSIQSIDTKKQPTEEVADPVADRRPASATNFLDVLARMKRVTGTKSDTAFARAIGIRQSSVSAAKERQSIPPAWAVQIAENYGASLDWLMFGEGEMTREDTPDATDGDKLQGKTTQGGDETSKDVSENVASWLQQGLLASDEEPCRIYNDSKRRSVSIADMLAKTAKVLESDTVYREALYSNIEAFHHGVTMDERISRMEAQMTSVMDSVQARLDALEAENQQLRQELEHSRAQSTLSDTG